MQSLDVLPFGVRVSNAFVSYVNYLIKMLCPVNLAVFYPHPQSIEHWKIFTVLLLLLCLTSTVFIFSKRGPFLLVGWLWFLGTLVPVIGLVQVGGQAMADRYTYVPSIGIFVGLLWSLATLCVNRSGAKFAVIGGVALYSCFLFAATWSQVEHWRSSVSLFEHAVSVTEENHLAHNNLASALTKEGKTEEAIKHFQKAIEINPNYGFAHNNLGIILGQKGELKQAIHHFSTAIHIDPHHIDARYNLGVAHAILGNKQESYNCFRMVATQQSHYMNTDEYLQKLSQELR